MFMKCWKRKRWNGVKSHCLSIRNDWDLYLKALLNILIAGTVIINDLHMDEMALDEMVSFGCAEKVKCAEKKIVNATVSLHLIWGVELIQKCNHQPHGKRYYDFIPSAFVFIIRFIRTFKLIDNN